MKWVKCPLTFSYHNGNIILFEKFLDWKFLCPPTFWRLLTPLNNIYNSHESVKSFLFYDLLLYDLPASKQFLDLSLQYARCNKSLIYSLKGKVKQNISSQSKSLPFNELLWYVHLHRYLHDLFSYNIHNSSLSWTDPIRLPLCIFDKHI